jgi:hypothetical protein
MPAIPPAVLPSPDPSPRLTWGWLKTGWCRTPITVMVVYCLISLWLKENYPFSHYPMYSNPVADRTYYVLSDAADGKPLPVQTLSGITCPKIGKMFRTISTTLTKKSRPDVGELTAEQNLAVARKIFEQLRLYAKQMDQTLPAKLQLQRVHIEYRDGRVVETPELVARE